MSGLPVLPPKPKCGDECNGCGTCAENTCHFHAISMDDEAQKAVINLEKCMGCGVCVAACPSKAIMVAGFTDQQIYEEVMNAV